MGAAPIFLGNVKKKPLTHSANNFTLRTTLEQGYGMVHIRYTQCFTHVINEGPLLVDSLSKRFFKFKSRFVHLSSGYSVVDHTTNGGEPHNVEPL